MKMTFAVTIYNSRNLIEGLFAVAKPNAPRSTIVEI